MDPYLAEACSSGHQTLYIALHSNKACQVAGLRVPVVHDMDGSLCSLGAKYKTFDRSFFRFAEVAHGMAYCKYLRV